MLTVAAPGPGVAAVIARGLAHGLKGAPAFIAGFLVGDLIRFGIAATGLAALARTAAIVFVVIKWIGVAYLLYPAWRLRTAPAGRVELDSSDREPHGWRAAVASLTLTLANPKAVILAGVLGIYTYLAARPRRLFTTPTAVRGLNRSSGVAMAGAAAAIATR